MRFFTPTKRSSMLALAFALSTGTVFSMTVIAAPAQAQKKNAKAEAPKTDYSKPFVAAYQPLTEQLQSTPDYNAIKAALPGVIAAVETEDDRHAAGNLVLSVGQNLKDPALQLQGLELMLASGKVPAETAPQYNYFAGQLSFQADEHEKARTYIQRAIDLGYTQNDPQIIIAESYFAQDDYAAGLKYLSDAIAAKRAAGQPVSENWIERGMAMAYNNQLNSEALQFATMHVRDYPSEKTWGNVIGIVLNMGGYQAQETLDLLRLARRTNSFRQSNQYLEYIDAADPRKLPGEVRDLIDEGYASGMLDKTNPYVTESRSEAVRRVETDKSDLPQLAREARAANADLVTLMAAGDAFLSYGRGAEAEEFYAKAQGMGGVNTPLVLTRLGIAQLDQGKYAEAEATFNKVQGARQAIANLWSVYSTQQSPAS